MQAFAHREAGVDERAGFGGAHRAREHRVVARRARAFHAPVHDARRDGGVGPDHEVRGAAASAPGSDARPAVAETQGLLPHRSRVMGGRGAPRLQASGASGQLAGTNPRGVISGRSR